MAFDDPWAHSNVSRKNLRRDERPFDLGPMFTVSLWYVVVAI